MKKFIISIVMICLLLLISACSQSGEKSTTTHEHSFGEWVVMKEASILEEGIQERTCACGETETEAIPTTEIKNAEDAFILLGSDKWRGCNDFAKGYYSFATSSTGFFQNVQTNVSVAYEWAFKDGFVTLTYKKSGSTRTFEIVKEAGPYALKYDGGTDYFVREAEYETGFATYSAQIIEPTEKPFNIETDNATIYFDKSIVLANGDVIVELIGLAQENQNVVRPPGNLVEALEKGVIIKVTNNSKQDARAGIGQTYIGNKVVAASSAGGNPLKPGKTAQSFYSFDYVDHNNYPNEELASLYDLVKVTGTLKITYYPDENHYLDGPTYDFDMSRYSSQIKSAIDNYVKSH